MIGLHRTLANAGIEHEYEETGDGSANIHIRSNRLTPDPASEVPSDSWDMPAQETDLDIFEHPNAINMENAQANSIGKIRREVKRYNEWDEVEEDASYVFPSTFGSYNTLAAKFFSLAIKGTTHFKKPIHVLRHRQTVSENYAADIAADVAGTERIYTTTQLLNECANYARPLPTRLRRKLAAINSSKAAAPSGYMLGWRKLPSGEQTVAGGKVEVSTEYILEFWSTTLYDPL